MTIQKLSAIAGSSLLALALSVGVASADTLTVACAGVPTPTSVTWTSTVTGGVAPVALLWSNSGTTSTQVVNYAPGLRSISIRATDASSTVATSTCSATVPQAVPTITSFGASATAITVGQSTILSWVVSNASSTSIDNGLGVISSTSVTVSPTVTTTYHLTATNPGGSATSAVTVVVNGVVTPPTGVSAQIAALLQQINALKAQLFALIAARSGGNVGTTTPPVVTPPGLDRVCDRIESDLSRGRHGGDVQRLQRFLVAQQLMGTSSATGVFGPLTEKALKRLQRENGLGDGSGIFGANTRKFFEKHCEDSDEHEDKHSNESTASSASTSVNVSAHENENEHDNRNDDHGKKKSGGHGGKHGDDN